VIVRRAALAVLASVMLVALPCRSALAEFSAKNGQVLGRTLGFVGDGMTGTAIVGVVFTQGDLASQRDADLIQAVIGDGLAAGRVRLWARLVATDQLATVTGLNALYVPSGFSGRMDPVSGTAQRLHIPTLSADLACVQSDTCVVGFSSEPTVQIVIDRAAAERAGVHFVQAFRMLVKEK